MIVEVNIWFIIINSLFNIVIIGIIGYKGILYGLCKFGFCFLSFIIFIKVNI